MYIQKFKPDFLRNYFADLNHFFMKAFQVLYVLCFTRPRYQVSVYRTTGPLAPDRIVFSDFMLTWKKNIFIYKNVILSENSENHR